MVVCFCITAGSRFLGDDGRHSGELAGVVAVVSTVRVECGVGLAHTHGM